MIICRTPYRVSFLGGGCDFPVYYNENPAAVLSTSIDKYCYLSVRNLPPFFDHKSRIVWSQIELVGDNIEIKHPAVRETLKYLGVTHGVEIHHAGDLPHGTGMGTSSAFCVGLVNALSTLMGIQTTKALLANQAIHIEQDLVKDCVGSQDQTATAYGGFNRIDFNGSIRVKPVNPGKLQDHLMLLFTGFQRQATTIEKAKLANIQSKKADFAKLYHMVGEGEKLLKANSLHDFGRLLDEGWRIKRSMAEKTSTGYIDYLYKQALDAGAIGGKLLGAGGGGFLLLMVDPDRRSFVRDTLGILEVPFRFETGGSQVIFRNGD